MKIKPYLISTSLMTFCGFALAVLGLLAVLGWHLHHPSWTEMNAGYVGMVYNAALMFLAGGLALVLRAFHKKAPCLWVGRAVAVVALISLFEHLFQAKTGIDQLFFSHTLRLESAHPGRMATNSALALLLFGVGLILAGSSRKLSGKNLALGLCGVLTLIFGADALLGHYAQVQIAFRWGSVPMALNTALAFFLGGVALLAFVGRHAAEEGIFSPRWISAVAGTCAFIYAVGQWQTLVSREEMAIARSASIYSSHFSRFLEIRLQQEFSSATRLAQDLSDRGDIGREAWDKEMKSYFFDRPFLMGTELKDGNWSRLISTGRGANVFSPVGKQDAFAHYARSKTRFFRREGDKGAIIEFAIPVTSSGNHGRYLVASLDASSFISNALATYSSPRYAISVTAGAEEIFITPGAMRSTRRAESQISSVTLDGVHWFVRVRPTQTEYDAYRSYLPEVVFTFEALFALFVFLSLRAGETRSRLGTLLNAIEDGIIGIELDGNIGAWSRSAERIFGYREREIIGKPFNTIFYDDCKSDANASLEKAKTTDSQKCKLTGRNKAGEAINLSMMLNPVRDGFNQVIGISAITRDIWTQSQKEEWRKKNGIPDERQVA